MICEDWITQADLVGCDDCPEPSDPEALDRWVSAAVEIVFLLSGSAFTGTCNSVWRPCLPGDHAGISLARPVLVDGLVYNVNPCSGCGVGLYLPFDYPTAVTEVKIDGVTLDPANYRLSIPDRRLYLRAPYHWAHNQDLAKADSEVGTFSITVAHGMDPPAFLRQAAIDYASELVKGCSGLACALPARAVSIVKQGVSIDLGIAESLLSAGRTGLPSVDSALAAVNPFAQRSRSRFISVDVPGTMGI